MHLAEKTISSKTAYKGCIFTVSSDTAELENGSVAQRDVIHHHGGVGVIPINQNNEIYLVKQFRYPFGEITLEIPAGKLEKDENHAECGRRELLEETGLTCKKYSYLGEIYPLPAYDTEIIHLYLAEELELSEQSPDADEFLDIVKMPLDEAVSLVMNGSVKDSKTQIAILKAAVISGCIPHEIMKKTCPVGDRSGSE